MATRVLQSLAQNADFYRSVDCRDLRKALQPLVELQSESLFGGEGSKDAYLSKKEQKKARAAVRNQQKLEDAKFVKKTLLRAGRISRLESLVTDQPELGSVPLVLDGVALDSFTEGSTEPAQEAELQQAIQCYTCKARFKTLHFFYDKLCPDCAAFNWTKRNATCDMTSRVSLVTGARVKIGFQTALKLLRAGSIVIGTTRFAQDCAARYQREPDFASWKDRLHIYALDFRDLVSLENFCAHLMKTFSRLDVIINNACQTVRRPAAFYAHLVDAERTDVSASPPEVQKLLAYNAVLNGSGGENSAICAGTNEHPTADETAAAESITAAFPAPKHQGAVPASGRLASAEMSQLVLLPEDALPSPGQGLYDVNHQTIDLRRQNSWLMRLHEVSTPEVAEVFAINALAPYVLVAKLRGMMTETARASRERYGDVSGAGEAVPSSNNLSLAHVALNGRAATGQTRKEKADGNTNYQGYAGGGVGAEAQQCHRHETVVFIVNVSSMEGKFYRRKLSTHPHTNMAKAALNMMTRTSAGDYAKDSIFMTAVDTGWINEENPIERAQRTAEKHGFATPLDEVDAAARILDPIFAPLLAGQQSPNGACSPPFGAFLKDFHIVEW